MLKRLFDIIFSFLGLIFLLPIFIVISFLIKFDSAGPVFYRGIRTGQQGRHFKIYKFRTMVVNAEKIGGPSTANDDQRITRSGRYLRKYKLDELPQLISVFKGEMSFVGPRPEVSQYIGLLTKKERTAILSIRPGITDYASLWNSDEGSILAGSPNPEKVYLEKIRPRKIKLQLKYVRHHSLLIDIKIILKTLKIVFSQKSPTSFLPLNKGEED